MGSEIKSLFLHEKPAGVMLSLKDNESMYASVISKEIDCTYTHTLKILDQLHEYGLVEFEKKGRIKEVRLTPKGDDVAHELEGVVRQLEKTESRKDEEPEVDEQEKETE